MLLIKHTHRNNKYSNHKLQCYLSLYICIETVCVAPRKDQRFDYFYIAGSNPAVGRVDRLFARDSIN
jgi:hypothetical protein